MTDALEDCFVDVEVFEDAERHRRWRLRPGAAAKLPLREDTALEALEIGIRDAKAEGRIAHAATLSRLRDRILHDLPARAARRAEADAEAVLASISSVARPGPHAPVQPEIAQSVHDALRGPFRMRIRYETDPLMTRLVEPLGVLMGDRSYLVARQPESDQTIRHFRLDRITSVEITDESFLPPEGFDLSRHAERAFSAWHDPAQYGEVIWRFSPEAAEAARRFLFHPRQKMQDEPDGSLRVSFHASGWLEMAWHLYQWGNKVEVVAPAGLREMTEKHRRGDFASLP